MSAVVNTTLTELNIFSVDWINAKHEHQLFATLRI